MSYELELNGRTYRRAPHIKYNATNSKTPGLMPTKLSKPAIPTQEKVHQPNWGAFLAHQHASWTPRIYASSLMLTIQ